MMACHLLHQFIPQGSQISLVLVSLPRSLQRIMKNKIEIQCLNESYWIECLTATNNTFDQLCINYSNERVQNFFVDRMLLREKEYYDNQCLNIPFVPFLDNSLIIGKYVHFHCQFKCKLFKESLFSVYQISSMIDLGVYLPYSMMSVL